MYGAKCCQRKIKVKVIFQFDVIQLPFGTLNNLIFV